MSERIVTIAPKQIEAGDVIVLRKNKYIVLQTAKAFDQSVTDADTCTYTVIRVCTHRYGARYTFAFRNDEQVALVVGAIVDGPALRQAQDADERNSTSVR